MAAMNFPSSPSDGATFISDGGVTYIYNSAEGKWKTLLITADDALPLTGGGITGNLSVSGAVSLSSGAATAPTLQFTGDANTGIYSPGADQVAISTGGTGRLFVNSNGNISVGSTTNDSVGSTTTLTIDQSSGNGQVSLAANGTVRGRIFADNSTSEFRIGNPTENPLMFYTSNTERLRIDSSGRVGVGTSSPSAKLQVNGVGDMVVSQSTVGQAANLFLGKGGSSKVFSVDQSGNLKIGSNLDSASTTNITLNTTGTAYFAGNVGVGTTSPTETLTLNAAAGASLGFEYGGTEIATISNNNAALYVHAQSGKLLSLGADGSEKMRIDSSGRVGIGTSSPDTNLHVVGTSGSGSIQIGDGASDTQYHYINFGGRTGGTHNAWQIGRTPSGGVGPANGFYIYDLKNTATRLVVDTSGNVGIGTTSPGSKLDVRGNSTGDAKIRLDENGSFQGALQLRGNDLEIRGSSGTIEFYRGNNNEASSTEIARFDTSGRLLVGTSSTSIASALLTIQSSSPHFYIQKNSLPSSGNALGGVRFADNSNNLGGSLEAWADASWSSGTSHPTRLVFATTADGASSPTERMRIVNNGRLDLYSTDAAAWGQFARMTRFGYGGSYKCLMLGGTETASHNSISLGYNVANNASGSFSGDGREIVVRNNSRIISPNATDNGFLPNLYFNLAGHGTTNSHGGIAFGTDTAAANVLDDYEEGSWTPTFTNAGTLTYSIRVGRYTRIGNLVHATCHLDVNAKGTASGNLRVSGLPFTSIDVGNYHAVSSTVHGTNWSTARRSVNILLAKNTTATDIYHNMVGTTNSSNPSITGSDWGFVSHDDIGTGNLLFSITYQAA